MSPRGIAGTGQHTIKYAAWGDGHDTSRIVEHPDGAFTVGESAP
jgi:hypothetical protein